ncbi:MAG: hypothetical protein LBT00_02985 [Spirochaetaceae bacterium]|jgi:hypothetical protein|nr:hypothetical protein [Spirochaetaceae bacterium]
MDDDIETTGANSKKGFEEQERQAFIAKLLQRLGDEDWHKWLDEEKQAIDSIKISPNDDTAVASRERFYDELLKKIGREIEFLRRQ